jgi:hypothetical protein
MFKIFGLAMNDRFNLANLRWISTFTFSDWFKGVNEKFKDVILFQTAPKPIQRRMGRA